MKKYPDSIGDMQKIYDKIQYEYWEQVNKWGIQKRTLFEWMVYLTEEVGELAQAISEAVQVAALACKIVAIIQPYKGVE